MAPVFGYWEVRGLGQYIRLLLEYVGEQYEEKTYRYGPAPDFDKNAWFSVKPTMDLPIPNLPYYIDGDVKQTQSYAIMRHLGRKYDLCGRTEKERMTVDLLMEQGKDMRFGFYITCQNYTEEGAKKYITNLKETLKLLSNILGNQSWFAGDKITLADFVMYEELDVTSFMDPKYLDSFPNLKNFVKRFEELPAIKKFLSSPRHFKSHVNGPKVKFGPGE
ncbi:glutathione S-transferase Mu 6-like [Macrobrachium rosenbergii]|uniref:glutathione S-transferase Mu 6-like n=1 Tax=Macrobrachium rosenbergii TaxID=79674 RepID=UPI0034D4EEA7